MFPELTTVPVSMGIMVKTVATVLYVIKKKISAPMEVLAGKYMIIYHLCSFIRV